MIRALRRVARDRRGVYAVEFALIAPTMFLLLMGVYDLLHRNYVQDVLDGEMQRVARASSLEGGPLKMAEIDARMQKMVRSVSADAVATVTRTNTPDFLTVRAERFTDGNANDVCDNGEPFSDINENGRWDKNPGQTGQGGANDVTKIRAVIKFPRILPMAKMLGWDPNMTLVSETVLKNQPFAAQANRGVDLKCD